MDGKPVWVLYMLVIVSLLLSGFAAFSMHFDVDSASFPLGVMTLLVTTLVGFQIYSTIDTKEQIKKIKSDFEQKSRENERSTNDVKAMLFSVCADLLKKEYNNSVQAYEYYMYALRNYLFGKHRKSSIDKTLSKMEDALLRDNEATSFESDEMFYAILNEIKTSEQLSNEQQVILERLESIRKTGNNTEDN